MAVDRKDLHDLIDAIAPEDVNTVRKILLALSVQPLNEHWVFDDSPLTNEELEAILKRKCPLT